MSKQKEHHMNLQSMNEEFLYFINYSEGEEQLCKLEMNVLFDLKVEEKLFFSNLDINPSRSIFFKERLQILYRAASFESLVESVKINPMSFESYKILFIRLPQHIIEYKERLQLLYTIGAHIGGEADMYEPKQLLALTEVNGEWLFGILEKNNNEWVSHENKPHSYSFSLSVRNARAVANIAIGRDLSQTVIDPCCGAGTVVLEALTVGGNIVGNELNPSVAWKAQENLKHYGYENVIQMGDIADIKAHYDVSIVDLPYGHFSPIEPQIQSMIMQNARRISDKLVMVTQIIMDDDLRAAGFEIMAQCQVKKGKFIRYVTVCK
ncbi:MAG: TRM11 family SAM-dependent methyltransferase [Turicibacter sp.]